MEAPINRMVNFLMARAIERGASDIHLEPFEKAPLVGGRD
jgi:type II secretory ATPase GspE/PulE/Tfp pilus assembly ATPase PilB-like protein